jgi:hypothetical protein
VALFQGTQHLATLESLAREREGGRERGREGGKELGKEGEIKREKESDSAQKVHNKRARMLRIQPA